MSSQVCRALKADINDINNGRLNRSLVYGQRCLVLESKGVAGHMNSLAMHLCH